MKPPCKQCYGKGWYKKRSANPWQGCYAPCPCGRPIDRTGRQKLEEQKRLEERYNEIKTKGW